MIHWWLYISREALQTERPHCHQESKNLFLLEARFRSVEGLNLEDQRNQTAAQALLDKTTSRSICDDYPCIEPSVLADIQAARPKKTTKEVSLHRAGE